MLLLVLSAQAQTKSTLGSHPGIFEKYQDLEKRSSDILHDEAVHESFVLQHLHDEDHDHDVMTKKYHDDHDEHHHNVVAQAAKAMDAAQMANFVKLHQKAHAETKIKVKHEDDHTYHAAQKRMDHDHKLLEMEIMGFGHMLGKEIEPEQYQKQEKTPEHLEKLAKLEEAKKNLTEIHDRKYGSVVESYHQRQRDLREGARLLKEKRAADEKAAREAALQARIAAKKAEQEAELEERKARVALEMAAKAETALKEAEEAAGSEAASPPEPADEPVERSPSAAGPAAFVKETPKAAPSQAPIERESNAHFVALCIGVGFLAFVGIFFGFVLWMLSDSGYAASQARKRAGYQQLGQGIRVDR